MTVSYNDLSDAEKSKVIDDIRVQVEACFTSKVTNIPLYSIIIFCENETYDYYTNLSSISDLRNKLAQAASADITRID